MYKCLHVQYPILSYFKQAYIFSIDIRKKNLKYKIPKKIRTVKSESFHDDRWTDGRTDEQIDRQTEVNSRSS